MRRYAEVENPAPVGCQHEEHVKDLKADGWHGEKVGRDQVLEMVGEKGPPRLGWRVPAADHVLAHTGLADVDAELQKLAVNPWSTPYRILAADSANQIPQLFRHHGSARNAASDLPGPEQSEAFLVPGDYRCRLDDDKNRSPVAP
jgi:hypothetical protein